MKIDLLLKRIVIASFIAIASLLSVNSFLLNISALGDGSIDETIQISSLTPNGPALQDGATYGGSVCSLGDLDGDGVIDIAVGALFDASDGPITGAVYIHFMNSDGSIKSTRRISGFTPNGPVLIATDNFGRSITNIGDLNNDGVIDIAVGSPNDDAGGSNRGTVHIMFLNTDGSIDSTVEINDLTANGPVLNNEDRYAAEIDSLGDLDGDDIPDLIAGVIGDDAGGSDRGAVEIMYLNRDGSVKSTVEINDLTANGPTLANSDNYGRSVSNIGDLNRDGVIDIAVGANQNDTGGSNRGAVFISFLNTDGSVDSTVTINSFTTNGPTLENEMRYGTETRGIGDLNGDGTLDIAVGSTGSLVGMGGLGVVYVHFLNPDGSIIVTSVINKDTPNGPSLNPNDRYGAAIANIGDLNGDGINDLAVTANMSAVGGTDRGVLYIHLMGNLLDLKDTMSRLATSAISDHDISFGTRYGLLDQDAFFVLEFDPQWHAYDFNAITLSDIELADLNNNLRNIAGSAGVDTWGVEIDSVAETITFNAPTSGSGYYPASGHIVVRIGLNAGGSLQIENPATTGLYGLMVTLHNDAPHEQGEASVPIVDSDQVNITGFVNTFINFDIDTAVTNSDCTYSECLIHETGDAGSNYTVDLGELNSSWVNVSNGTGVIHSDGNTGIINSIYFDLTTNAYNGAVVYVRSANAGLQGPNTNIISPLGYDGYSIEANSGRYGYLVPATFPSGNGSIGLNGACSNPLAGNFCAFTQASKELFNTGGKPIDNGRVRMDIAAAAAYTNNPGAYTDTLTFIVVPTY